MTDKNKSASPRCSAERREDKKTTPPVGLPVMSSVSPNDESVNNCFVMDLLPFGEEKAILTDDLLKLVGLSDKRALQKEIERERLAGALIASRSSHPGGYFRPASRDELLRFYWTCRRKANSVYKMLQPIRRALREVDGQLSLGSDDEQT